jgi:hypothetical protein
MTGMSDDLKRRTMAPAKEMSKAWPVLELYTSGLNLPSIQKVADSAVNREPYLMQRTSGLEFSPLPSRILTMASAGARKSVLVTGYVAVERLGSRSIKTTG